MTTPRRLALLPLAALAIAAAPLLAHGFPKGTDWSLELVRIAEFRYALAESARPPAWAGHVYGGFGAPVFVYYAPLFSLLACAFSLVTGSLWTGAVAALIALAAAAGLGIARLAHALCDRGDAAAAGRVAACAFVLSPYLLRDAWLRNANAEFAALALAPLALLGAAQLSRRPRTGAATLAAGLALCVLAHNLTALAVAAAVLAALALERARAAPAAGAVALGLALACFFWLPALVYQPLMRSEELVTGKFEFARHFVSPAQAFGYARLYAAGALAPALLAAGALAAARAGPGRSRRWLLACLAAAVVCAWLAMRASRPLWQAIPGLALFQFPWRWLGPLSLAAALAGGLGFAALLSGRPRRLRVAAEIAVFAACVGNALPTLLRARPLDPEPRARLAQRLAPATIRDQALAVTVRDEYLPRGADPQRWREPSRLARPVLDAPPLAELRVLEDRPTRIRLELRSQVPGRVSVARWRYPGWRLHIDASDAAFAESPDGELAFELPAGAHRVELEFRDPPLRAALLPVSGAALLAWIALAWPRRA